jgi:hypothetical protein
MQPTARLIRPNKKVLFAIRFVFVMDDPVQLIQLSITFHP